MCNELDGCKSTRDAREIEAFKRICELMENHKCTRAEAAKMLLEQRPELEDVLRRVGLIHV